MACTGVVALALNCCAHYLCAWMYMYMCDTQLKYKDSAKGTFSDYTVLLTIALSSVFPPLVLVG